MAIQEFYIAKVVYLRNDLLEKEAYYFIFL